jgi:ubiquitin C-terminal hydrolase
LDSTLYMNTILQCLLNIDTFAKDVRRNYELQKNNLDEKTMNTFDLMDTDVDEFPLKDAEKDDKTEYLYVY